MNKLNENPTTSTTIDLISQEFPDIAKHVLQESAVEFLKQNKCMKNNTTNIIIFINKKRNN